MRATNAQRDILLLGVPGVLLTAAGFALCSTDSAVAGAVLSFLGVAMSGWAALRLGLLGGMIVVSTALAVFAFMAEQRVAGTSMAAAAFCWLLVVPFHVTRHRVTAGAVVALIVVLVTVIVFVVLLILAGVVGGVSHLWDGSAHAATADPTCLVAIAVLIVPMLGLAIFIVVHSVRSARTPKL